MRKNSLDTIFRHLPDHLRSPLIRAAPFLESDAHEIILRAERPLTIECASKRYYISDNGTLTNSYHTDSLLISSRSDILSVFKSICDYSVYARQNELNQGYITVSNGIRVGICGTAVITDGRITNIKDITTLSFRVAAEIIGCSDMILNTVDALDGILVCGAPCSGKTTVIRDMARQLSDRYKVSVLDERSELSAAVGGVSAYDLGLSDILIGMPKGDGVIHALRGLSPDIIICDELGGSTDARMLRDGLRCGVSFIATVHASDMDDLYNRAAVKEILDTGAFRSIVFLSGRRHAGEVKSIYERRDGQYEAVAVYDDRRRVACGRSVPAFAAQRADKDPVKLYHPA